MNRKGKYGDAPAYEHVADESKRALLIQLRDAVAPILDNNTLPHFTDHSVLHSDGVTSLVDELVAPIQGNKERLTEQELVILYSACYLHDIGLQYESAGETRAVAELNLEAPWIDLPIQRRRDILREMHHRISAEMVQASVRAASPVIGVQLTSAYQPSKIACLCESHNLYLEQEADLERYNELTEDGPGIRMKLLAGLLRVADILEESRRRAIRSKADTLLLDLTSQKHWWRHYYTEDVVFDPSDRSVVIWFDFPPDKFDSYSRIIPELQKPWIEAEFNRHAATFNKYGVNWTVKAELKAKQYSDTLSMPDAVTTAMIGELQSRHLKEDERRRAVLLSTFQESRPHIEQRLNQLRQKKASISPGDYLQDLADLSNELWEIGSKRSALMNIAFEFDRSNQQLTVPVRVKIGTRLLDMCVEEDSHSLANGWVPALLETARNLDHTDRLQFPCLRAIANWYVASCDYASAKQIFGEAIKATTDQDQILLLKALCLEVDFANGELGSIIATSESESAID